MGKFRSKLKGQPKGKRWARGQSSSSNPETKKYRDQAKSRFFQENLGPSSLTTDALRQHDAISSFVPPKLPSAISTQMDEDTEESEQQTYSTIKTFASDWSECSNTSFSKLLHIFRPDSAMHKEMLAVLAAVTEVIKQNGGTESSTEYFAALMTTLEVTEAESNLAAVLALLNMGIRSVPPSVLRLKFAKISKLYIDLLNENAHNENVIIIKSLISLIANLLRVQEIAAWSSISTIHVFGSILAFAIHTKPRVRKAAHQGICSVLKGSCFMLENPPERAVTNHPGAAHVAQFCVQQIESSSGTTGQTTTLHILSLLKDVIHTFPKAQIKSTCETILKIMTLNNPLINSCGMQVLHSLFSAQSTTMPALLNGQLISAIYDYQPAVTDVQPTLAWVAVMQQAHIHLSDVDVMVSISALPKIILTLTQLWLSERVEVMNATTHALASILEDCVAPACSNSDIVETTKNHLQKCFATIESCLGYQYNKAWHQVLHVIAIMFKVGGKHCSHMLLNCLKQLAELRDSYKFSYNNELEFAVGAAVKSMGPDVVLEIISLKKKDGEINIDRSWLLPVLKENVEYSTLEYFVKSILPLALLCQKKSAFLSANNDGIGAHSYELLYIQLWNLLPSFCRYPTDVKDHFKSIAKVLGTAISDHKELRLAVMGSIRKLIVQCKETESEGEKKEIGRFGKNYLPILFNLYTIKPSGTDEEGQRLAALDTIKEYLSICPEDLIKQLFTNALTRLQTINDQDESFAKESILDLIRILSSYQDNKSIQTLYDQCIKNLLDLKNKKEQKKAYRLLEEICNSESEGCKKFLTDNRKQVQSLLMKSLNSVAVSSRGARLRCLNCLVKLQPQLRHDSKLLKSVVPEAVLCCKDINKKCRLAANNLLVSVGETLERHDQMTEYVAMVIAGLAGDTHMVTATILAMASATHNFSGALGNANIHKLLETIGHLMTSSTREIVSACLVYIKIFISSLPSPLVGSSLPIIVKSITEMTDDCKSHFRNRTRDLLTKLIRKYGYESISTHIPETDTVMHKRIRNIRKIQTRKKKQKEEWKKQQDEESDDEEFAVKAKPRSMEDILADSDSDFDEMEVENQPPKQRKAQTWIQEDIDSIVDFTDPSAISKITATRPGQQRPQASTSQQQQQKNKDRGFKMSSDGRLIIGDDSSGSEDDDPKKGFINLNSDSESEDDHKSAAETAILGNKKRKRSDVESVRSGNSQPAMKYKAGGSGIHRPIKSSAASVYSDVGSEYRSKKAKGDVKKTGKVDPYAYLPLVRTTLNKRKRGKNAGQFKNIVRAAKNGARKGTKAGKKVRNK